MLLNADDVDHGAVLETELVLVGEARLRAVQHRGDDPRKLLDAVLPDLLAAGGGSARGAAVALREKSRRQFETGDVVSVDGWILARAEADLCALIALDRFPERHRRRG